MWNYFQNSGLRTNNHLEVCHYRLTRKAYPNLFETIELIKNEQASTEVQMIQLAAGGQPRPKKEKLLSTMCRSKDIMGLDHVGRRR